MEDPKVFEEVLIRELDQERSMTRDAFIALPLTVRVRYLLTDSIRFRLRGSDVETRDALRSI